MIKLRREGHNLSQKSLFWTSKQTLAIRSFIASYNVCPPPIPELFAQTQRSDHWQLTHWGKCSGDKVDCLVNEFSHPVRDMIVIDFIDS